MGTLRSPSVLRGLLVKEIDRVKKLQRENMVQLRIDK